MCDFKQDIADAAYRKKRGRPQLPSLGKAVADILFSLLLQGLFLLQVNIDTSTQNIIVKLYVSVQSLVSQALSLLLSHQAG